MLQAKEQVIGSTGYPADSFDTVWMKLDFEHPRARCPLSGNGMYTASACFFLYSEETLEGPNTHTVYELEYIGPEDHAH